jgi:putative tricarboxylic transport membrane protein
VRRARLVLVAGSFLLGIIYLAATFRYPLGTARQPGPGLYPLIVGGLLLLSSSATAWQIRSMATRDIEWPQGAGRWRTGAILLAIFAYIVLLPDFGHPIASALTIFISLQALGGLRWPTKILLAVFLGVASFYLFNNLLGVPLPGRIWFR